MSNISQGSVVTRLTCGGICNDNYYCKLTAASDGERILKSSQHMT